MRIPERPPDTTEHLKGLPSTRLAAILSQPIRPDVNATWMHWDEFRRKPLPEGFSAQDLWFPIAFGRAMQRAALPLRDGNGKPFGLCQPPKVLQSLHRLDLMLGLPLGEEGALRPN